MDVQVEPPKTMSEDERRLEARRRQLANLKPAQKGEVRNPRGRPKKDYNLAELAQKHAEKAVMTLVEVMSDEKATPAARVTAASESLDRGFGRAPQSLAVKHELTFSEQFEDFLLQLSGRSRPKMIDVDVLDAAE